MLLVIGARLDDRATGKLDEFAPHAKVIHLDIDPLKLISVAQVSTQPRHPEASVTAVKCYWKLRQWRDKVSTHKAAKAFDYSPKADISAPVFLRQLSDKMSLSDAVTCDVAASNVGCSTHSVGTHTITCLVEV